MKLLTINNINKSFKGKQIVKDFSFEIKTGEILVFFGRNGSGKSTLLELIYGTIKPDTIEILIDNETINQKNIISDNRIGYLPQNTFLPKNFTVAETIISYFQNGAKQDKIFYAPRINSIQNKKIGNLSAGEKRYLEILLVCNLNHSFIMLDEPFSMVEPLFIEIIKEVLNSIKNTKGIILTDHYYTDALQIANRVFLIKNGEKIMINDKNDLIQHGYLNG